MVMHWSTILISIFVLTREGFHILIRWELIKGRDRMFFEYGCVEFYQIGGNPIPRVLFEDKLTGAIAHCLSWLRMFQTLNQSMSNFFSIDVNNMSRLNRCRFGKITASGDNTR